MRNGPEVSGKAPSLPIIKSVNDSGFLDLHVRYKAYVNECNRSGVEPETIDRCIINPYEDDDRSVFEILFDYALHSIDDIFDQEQHVRPELVLRCVEIARKRAAEEVINPFFVKLEELRAKKKYDPKLYTFEKKVRDMTAKLVKQLEKKQNPRYIVVSGEAKTANKEAHVPGKIVEAIMADLKKLSPSYVPPSIAAKTAQEHKYVRSKIVEAIVADLEW